jgi:uncharacterized protein (DUF58 family)
MPLPPPAAHPERSLTRRGWGFLAAAVVCLLLAQLLGRRDLLHLGTLLAVMPLAAAALLQMIKPKAGVKRQFAPAVLEAGSTAAVTLDVRLRGAAGGTVILRETFPGGFGPEPRLRLHRAGRYHYRLDAAERGAYLVGPLTAAFTDPFGLASMRHRLGGTDLLLVTPAAQDLPRGLSTGIRDADGLVNSALRASAGHDDVMTREYRSGDPMRRVHWPATARHGDLMVRQEESVTTPQATLVMDQRHSAWPEGFAAAIRPSPGSADDGAGGPSASPAFEWAVTAAMSVAAHLIDGGYTMRFMDHRGLPALRRSVSAPWPEEEHHWGRSGLQHIAEGLAALRPEDDPAQPEAFAGDLLDKIAAAGQHGPVVALLGRLGGPEAQVLAPAAGYGSAAIALLAVDRPEQARDALAVLRGAGWRAAAVTPETPVPAAWMQVRP